MFPRALVLVLMLLILQGCGTRGSLYLPPADQKPPQNESSRK